MGLFHVHVSVGLLLLMVVDTLACGDGNSCGCIFRETTEIEEDDYVCEPIRSEDFQNFQNRMYSALWANWNAYTLVKTFPNNRDPPDESGTPLCPTERKHILGYFKNQGMTLCWVVDSQRQVVKRAECCGEECCGDNTRCEPGGYVLKKYLVYCDAIYTDGDGCLIGTEVLSETRALQFDESNYVTPAPPVKREADASFENTSSLHREKRFTGCPINYAYFAFKHDFLPSTCSCRRCDC